MELWPPIAAWLTARSGVNSCRQLSVPRPAGRIRVAISLRQRGPDPPGGLGAAQRHSLRAAVALRAHLVRGLAKRRDSLWRRG